jgi:hypothetical protein
MDQQRKDRILEKVAGLPGPLKARVVQSIKGFTPEIQKAVLHGHPIPKGGETMFRNATNQIKAIAATPVEQARINAHLAGKQATRKISTTTVLPRTRAKPFIQQGQQAKANFKQLRAKEQLARSDSLRTLGMGAGLLGLGGLGYMAMKSRSPSTLDSGEITETSTGAPAGSWG